MLTRLNKTRIGVASIAALLVTGGLSAATITVPTDQPTIQDAIDIAVNGDDIIVLPGTYNERIDFLGKAITVESTTAPVGTVIDGTGLTGPVVSFVNGEGLDSRLIGFKITGGSNPTGSGGGMVIQNADPYILSCNIRDNEAFGAAGVSVVCGSPLFIDCKFIENVTLSNTNGGGMLHNCSSATMLACTFRNNEGNLGGALYANGTSNIAVINSEFWDNEASSGSVAFVTGTLDMDNCTAVNSADAAVRVHNSGVAEIANSILRNDGSEIEITGAGSADVRYSNVEGGYSGPGNVDVDPRFVDADANDYRLDAGSPCIDAGTNLQVPVGTVIDRDSYPRFVDDLNMVDTGFGLAPVVDMGAYEWQATVRYVREDATGAETGASWDDAYTDLQDALDDAAAGDATEIWVASGTYKPDRGTGDRDATFALQSGVPLYGGFNGTETLREDRDAGLNQTTLGGAIGVDGTDDNSYHVVSAIDVTNARLDGFIVQRGYANGSVDDGAGMLINNSNVTVNRCLFRLNEAASQGGAIMIDSGSDVVLHRTRFGINDAGNAGGAVYVNESDASFRSCLVHGNNALLGAGGVYSDDSTVAFDNCTVVGNSTEAAGSGGLWSLTSTVAIRNSIIWDNQPGANGLQFNQIGGAGYDVRFSIIQDWSGGLGGPLNTGQDPRFEDADGRDDIYGTLDDQVRVMVQSPAIDSGSNVFVPAESTQDLDGGERRLDDPGMPDVGNGTSPLVDRGAFEFDGVSCLADFNADGVVDAGDLATLLSQWGACDGYCAADLDGDQFVGASDLATLLSVWGGCP